MKEKKSSEELMKELEELVKPLSEWLSDNYDPHCSIIIQYGRVTVVRDEIGIPLEVKD